MLQASFLKLPANSSLGLRDQICELISAAIADGIFSNGYALPSCRQLSGHLGVSRNTVYEAYCRLVDIGLVESKDRSCFCVTDEAVSARHKSVSVIESSQETASPLLSKLASDKRPSAMRKVDHPENWNDYAYPFIYNQIDPKMFPIQEWRESVRVAMGTSTLASWSGDAGGIDSPNLVRQLQQRLLTYRGIGASIDEILVTSGAQNAIFLLASINARMGAMVGIEDPCYPEARNAFALAGNQIMSIPIDADGLMVEQIPANIGLVYTTPSHQFPTTVTMPRERRQALCDMAAQQDFLICEDDYEAEMNFVKKRERPLRALDRTGRVVYVGSLSKCIAPGLRLGYMVAHPDIIREAKAIRRTIMRHPPGLLQDAMAHFIGSGYMDVHLRKLERRLRARWELTLTSINRYLPEYCVQSSQGGTSVWLTGPDYLDSGELAKQLRAIGVLIDQGSIFFNDPVEGQRNLRLGFAALSKNGIERGIAIIAEEALRQTP